MTELVETTDDDFVWMLGGPGARPGLRLPPGGVDDPQTLAVVRRIHAAAREAGRQGAWMMVEGGEVVGLCGTAGPPGTPQALEIGYSVAASRRRRGHAARAVAALIALARNQPTLGWLTAVTAADNEASAAVLVGAGFIEEGRETRDEDGPVILWRLALRGAPGGTSALRPAAPMEA